MEIIKYPGILLLAGCLLTACKNDAPAESEKKTLPVVEDINENNLEAQSETDAEQIADIFAGSIYEIRLAEAVTEKSSDKDMLAFAKMMAEAHRKINADIAALAKSKGIVLPEDIGQDERDKIKKLAEDKDFDRMFLDEMIKKHQDAIHKAEIILQNSLDHDIKAFFAKSIGDLKAHLDMAEVIRKNRATDDKVSDL